MTFNNKTYKCFPSIFKVDKPIYFPILNIHNYMFSCILLNAFSIMFPCNPLFENHCYNLDNIIICLASTVTDRFVSKYSL